VRRAGVDVGGTFTDIMLWDDEAGRAVVHKLPAFDDYGVVIEPGQLRVDGAATADERARRQAL
jgi:N-methylhydantoinase A/oxoprolinase/acetone carboxylase beta subunit